MTQRSVASAAGLSKRQETTARQVANIPRDEFEEASHLLYPTGRRAMTEVVLTEKGRSRLIGLAQIAGTEMLRPAANSWVKLLRHWAWRSF